MTQRIIAAIADYLEAPYDQVEQWDSRLVKYFASHPQVFEQFHMGCRYTKFSAWMQAMNAVAKTS